MKRKFWKNIFSLLMCFLLAIAAAVPCFAQENNQVVTTYTEDLGNATGADGTGTGINGWSYGGQSTWTSGNSAHLSATLSKGSVSVPVSISLSCDAHGNVS